MRYFKKMTGEHVYLSPMNMEDAETYVKWMNDSDVTDKIGSSFRITTVDGEKKWIEKNADSYQFAIVRKSDDTLIGNCSIDCVDSISQIAEVGIFIGDSSDRGNGYGTEVLKMLLDYGFYTLNLHNIMLRVFGFNSQAIRCYEKAGFKEFGRRREAYFAMGKRHDVIYMEAVRESKD
ncbi:MAG: GNAT family N-acetyltransferase [Lachnospiraceae bacterium]|nr:GNAT family N-acetyltransferase [Lachnospiraceae bacterium]